ncbi:hypothetical protein QBC34DRAFT_438781 [Podospora aff. communis PSN243]|uniref:Uncharacterized protein n=1 Tax=Podospora aff. communis PSN243 TaxID=3040156 RepID=A0AAV9GNE0_9PEZI|nr:hypothetical protein QBC34DRAFT_438781 [Podospora aff. communis PSN243]
MKPSLLLPLLLPLSHATVPGTRIYDMWIALIPNSIWFSTFDAPNATSSVSFPGFNISERFPGNSSVSNPDWRYTVQVVSDLPRHDGQGYMSAAWIQLEPPEDVPTRDLFGNGTEVLDAHESWAMCQYVYTADKVSEADEVDADTCEGGLSRECYDEWMDELKKRTTGRDCPSFRVPAACTGELGDFEGYGISSGFLNDTRLTNGSASLYQDAIRGEFHELGNTTAYEIMATQVYIMGHVWTSSANFSLPPGQGVTLPTERVQLKCLRAKQRERSDDAGEGNAFQLMDTLYIDGGHFLNEDASIATELEPTFVSYDLTNDFAIWVGPKPKENRTRSDAPVMYHGFMFSNLVDRAWLFGGKPARNATDPGPMSNDVWRFEPGPGDGFWTQLQPGDNATQERPYRGAGCNAPDLRKGYYLGGISDSLNPGGVPKYHHWLVEFDMDTETTQTFPVPPFVPIVNQSLVFLDTGSRTGALVALGGSVERNGTLSTAPLTSVFIFDIESRTWVEQPVTGLGGDLTEDGTVDHEVPDGGIPRARVSGCAVVGSAQDKTSHNVFYLGGTNETKGTSDIWVLSLPSAVWLKALPETPLNGAKTENSCIVIHNYYVWMTGGCFLDPHSHIPCMGYSWSPLIFNLQKLALDHYEAHWDGFFLHKNISNVIGGNHTGKANHTSPIFTQFADPLLKELFTPPYSDPNVLDHPFEFDDRSGKYTILLLLTPLVVAAVLYLGTLTARWILIRVSDRSHLRTRTSWRPSTFSPGFLIFLNLVPLFLIALIILLTNISSQPDDFAEHWSGGPDEDGIWTNDRWKPNSKFIRAPTLSLPPRGLISFYQDQGGEGLNGQKNSTQRIGEFNYWAFTYLPTLVAVLYGRLWKVLDDEVKRVDKFIRLGQPGGEKAKDSIFLEYHDFWVPLCIVQAWRRKHWRVAISSLGLTLGAIAIPIVQNYVFTWTLYSGGHLAWADTYSWLVALVDPWWSKVLIGLLATTFLCSLTLLVPLPRCDTGLKEDPRGLASVVSFFPGEPKAFHKSSNKQTLSRLRESIGNSYFRLVTQPNHSTPVLERITATPTTPLPQLRPRLTRNTTTATIASYLKLPLTKTQTTLQPLTRTLHRYLTNHALSFPFRPESLTLWLLLLLSLLSLTALIANGLERNARDQLWNYTIPLSPSIYLILAIFIQSIADVYDYFVRALHPFYALHQGARSASVLFEDYTVSYPHSVIPVVDMFRAFRRGDGMICFVIFASMATAVVAVFLGSLQLSSSYYGATTFSSDHVAATGSAWLVVLMVLVYAGIAWKLRGLAKGMKRPVETLGGVAPYVVFSGKLKADVEGVRGLVGVREKVRELERMGGRYALGRWVDEEGEMLFGVERQYEGCGRVDPEGTLS